MVDHMTKRALQKEINETRMDIQKYSDQIKTLKVNDPDYKRLNGLLRSAYDYVNDLKADLERL